MGREHDSLELDQLGRDLRLVLVDVEPGAGEPPLAQRAGQRRASTSPPREVFTRIAPGFIRCERAGVDQVMRLAVRAGRAA